MKLAAGNWRSASIAKNRPKEISAGTGTTCQPVSAFSFRDRSGHCGTLSRGMSSTSSPRS